MELAQESDHLDYMALQRQGWQSWWSVRVYQHVLQTVDIDHMFFYVCPAGFQAVLGIIFINIFLLLSFSMLSNNHKNLCNFHIL